MKKDNSIAASSILKLLRDKHIDDVFVSECKNGPSWGALQLLILDAWAMRKSWANPLTTGYEIKTSRSDFLGDEKWQGYLAVCNEFYFVCPSGIISSSELSDDVGLYEVNSKSTGLIRRKKAKYRVISLPESLCRYILMCRCRVVSPHECRHPNDDNLSYFENLVKQKEFSSDIGHRASRKIRELVSSRITRVEVENDLLKRKSDELQKVADFLKENGMYQDDQYSWCWLTSEVERRLKAAREVVSRRVLSELQQIEKFCSSVRVSLESSLYPKQPEGKGNDESES